MKWRKWNRWVHRELGYVFFGMTIIYGVSGIALNHSVTKHWNPSFVSRSEFINNIDPALKADIGKEYIVEILDISGEKENYKQYYFPNDSSLMIYLKNGHIKVDLNTGSAYLTKIRNRRVFREFNFLHYNKPKKLWTWFSDLYGFSLVLLAISGLFMVRGKKGITGQGAVLAIIGVLIPLIFLIIYVWF